MSVYASNRNYLSEASTRLIGLLPRKSKLPDWFTKSIEVQRYARAGDGRTYALLTVDVTRAWADVVTGTLFRTTDGGCWSSMRTIDLATMVDVAPEDAAQWSQKALERGRRRHRTSRVGQRRARASPNWDARRPKCCRWTRKWCTREVCDAPYRVGCHEQSGDRLRPAGRAPDRYLAPCRAAAGFPGKVEASASMLSGAWATRRASCFAQWVSIDRPALQFRHRRSTGPNPGLHGDAHADA